MTEPRVEPPSVSSSPVDEVASLGGIDIGDENVSDASGRLMASRKRRKGSPPPSPSASGSLPSSGGRMARKIAVAVVGMTVLVFGVLLIVLPGPAILVIPLGLAILATELVWARNLQTPLRRHLHGLRTRAQRILGRPRR